MSGQLKIVVADDERDTREFMHECLTYLGHDVRAAEDGRQLVVLCREFAPDLIITDYTMPGLDGLAAAREINRERQVPVVLISGRHDAQSLAGVEGVVFAFLAKPVKHQDLIAAVEAMKTVASRSPRS